MEIQERLNFIDSLDLYKRRALFEELLKLANDYSKSVNKNKALSMNIVSSLVGMSSAFESSEHATPLLDVALKITREELKNSKMLKSLLNDALYYSNYYPEKYNKEEIEKEIRLMEL